MPDAQWPPAFWMAAVEAFGPYVDDEGKPNRFLNALIPLADVRQFIYDFAKELVQIIPHQPPEYSRPVNGMVGAAFSGGAKVLIPIGRVGYNAQTHQVLWSVNKQGGPQEQTMYLDVQSVIPAFWQLLMMIPWDFVGELEATVLPGRKGADQPPKAGDVVAWLYAKLRDGLAGIGVAIPAIPGSFSSKGATFADIVIPRSITDSDPTIGYKVTNGAIEYKAIINNELKIAPGKAVTVSNIRSVANLPDPNAVEGHRVNIELPAAVLGKSSLVCSITSATQGVAATQATAATRNITFENTGTLWTAAEFVLRISNPDANPWTVPSGEYGIVLGVGYTGHIDTPVTLAPGGTLFVLFTANTKGNDPAYPAVGFLSPAVIAPALPAALALYNTSNTNGITGGPDITLAAGDYTLTDGKTYTFSILTNTVLSPGAQSALVPLSATTQGRDTQWKGSGAVAMAGIAPGTFPTQLHAEYSGGSNGVDADAGSPTVIRVSMQNTKSTVGAILPSPQDLLLYNIPAINFSQKIYDTAMELVEAIPHHPPVFTRKVWVGGVYCDFTYTLLDRDNAFVSASTQPPAIREVVDGKTLVITAHLTEEGGKFVEDRELLRYTFDSEVAHIVFEADTPGPDEFFAGLPDVGWDPEAIEAESAAVQALIDVTLPLVETAQTALDTANEALATAQSMLEGAGVEIPTSVVEAVTDAQAALNSKMTTLTKQQDRLALIGGRGNGLPSALENFRIAIPDELTVASKDIRLVGLEKGLPQEVDDEGTEILPATTTKFRMEVVIKPMGVSTPAITIPGSYAAYQPKRSLGTSFRMFAAAREVVTEADLAGAVAVVSAPFPTDWMDVKVKEIVSFGTDGSGDGEPGEDPGQPAEIIVDVTNNTDEDVTITDGVFAITVGGKSFVRGSDVSDSTVLFPKRSTLTYAGTSDGTSFSGQPLADLQIDFSCPVADTQAWARWIAPEDLTWIGEEFSFTGSAGVNRYLQARLRYKLYDDFDPETGKPAPSHAWYVTYTGEDGAGGTRAQTPHGVCNTIELQYDAVKRQVTVRNLRNGEFVTMRTNAVIWFLLQLLLLIPVEVI